MQTPPQLRFTANLQAFTVLDTQTGAIHHATGLMETATLRRNLELAHRPAAHDGGKMARRQERRQAGQ